MKTIMNLNHLDTIEALEALESFIQEKTKRDTHFDIHLELIITYLVHLFK